MTSVRATSRQLAHIQPARVRLYSAGHSARGSVGDKGTSKVYNKDGTNPNKNLVYLGVGALGLGAVYAMFMGKPEKVAEKAQSTSSAAR
ncbi:hypothetical protein VTH06DRAFT_4020 [Thermothelomyces fergusii]